MVRIRIHCHLVEVSEESGRALAVEAVAVCTGWVVMEGMVAHIWEVVSDVVVLVGVVVVLVGVVVVEDAEAAEGVGDVEDVAVLDSHFHVAVSIYSIMKISL